MIIGESWLDRIDAEIKKSDLMVVLLLANLFNLHGTIFSLDFDEQARELFFNLPTWEEQAALFSSNLQPSEQDKLVTIIEGLAIALADVDGTGENTELLELMWSSL